jgi:hypothetical protein
MNRSLDLDMITNQRLPATTKHSPKIPAMTKHSSQTGRPKSLRSKLLKDYQKSKQVA